MPFTFSHPAIILPLKYLPKNWFSLTGLIIGSLTPDFEYFIRMKVQSNYSHTFYGMFWFDLPLAILLSFIFHNIVRNYLFFNSPNIIKSRVLIFSTFNWNIYFKEHWIIILISIIIGISSHLFWDGFTHNHGYFVDHFYSLKNSFSFLENEIIPIWKMLQHTSTLLGAVIIIVSFFKLPKNTISALNNHQKYWKTISILTLTISILRFMINLKLLSLGNIIVTVISAFMISLIITPFLIKVKGSSKN